jgi:hypothetical protein
MFFDQSACQGWERDASLDERMRAGGMLQRPAPVPWREQEARALSRMLELPGG